MEKLRIELFSVESQISESLSSKIKMDETKALENIKTNSRRFYDFAKRKAKTNNGIGPLRNSCDKIVNDNKGMCELLANQYDSVFSKVLSHEQYSDIECKITIPSTQYEMPEIYFSKEVIRNALKKMRPNASPGPDGISGLLLEN